MYCRGVRLRCPKLLLACLLLLGCVLLRAESRQQTADTSSLQAQGRRRQVVLRQARVGVRPGRIWTHSRERGEREYREGKSDEIIAVGAAAITSARGSGCDVRVLMLVFYASLGCLMPYIPMYYKYIGIDSRYIGLFGAITPTVTFVVSTLWVT